MAFTPSDEDIQKFHKWHAVECNNRAWSLAEAPQRTPTEDEEMLHAAHAAAFHWSRVGTELHQARARMLLAHVHALLGNGAAALDWSRRSHETLLAHDPPDWERAFSHAVLAHAAHAAADSRLHGTEYARAASLGEAIADPEDKAIFQRFFRTLPVP